MNQSKLKLIFICCFSLLIFQIYATSLHLEIMPKSYQQSLKERKDHKFDDNQIRSFVYYWYGLHDNHAAVEKSLELLSNTNLLMIYPEMTVKNADDYKTWYAGVGKNIISNIHIIKKLNITFLPEHQYKLNVVVNWQAINKDNKFINIYATQEWLLVDGNNNDYPYVQQYKVLKFEPTHRN